MIILIIGLISIGLAYLIFMRQPSMPWKTGDVLIKKSPNPFNRHKYAIIIKDVQQNYLGEYWIQYLPLDDQQNHLMKEESYSELRERFTLKKNDN